MDKDDQIEDELQDESKPTILRIYHYPKPTMPYNQYFMTITHEIDTLMESFAHTKKDIGYGWRWTFENKLWFDIIDYKKTDKVFLRIGRGAWLVKTYPILYDLFDAVSKVVAKIEIRSVETLQEKHLVWIFEILDKTPKETNFRVK